MSPPGVVQSLMSDPVSVLSGIHRNLAPGGTLIVADERTEDEFTAAVREYLRYLFGRRHVVSAFPGVPAAAPC